MDITHLPDDIQQIINKFACEIDHTQKMVSVLRDITKIKTRVFHDSKYLFSNIFVRKKFHHNTFLHKKCRRRSTSIKICGFCGDIMNGRFNHGCMNRVSTPGSMTAVQFNQMMRARYARQ